MNLRTSRRATIHPQTAAQMTIPLVRGDVIDIAGPGGVKLEGLTVVLDEHVTPGAVLLVDGIPAAPLNALCGAPSVTVTAKRSAFEPLGVQA